MRRALLISTLGITGLAGCNTPSAPTSPQTQPSAIQELRDPNGNVIERDALAENEPPPPDIVEAIPPKPYPTALYIRGYWYHDRPRQRWTWIHGYWR